MRLTHGIIRLYANRLGLVFPLISRVLRWKIKILVCIHFSRVYSTLKWSIHTCESGCWCQMGCNPSSHCSLCFCGKGHEAGERVVMSQYKTTVPPPSDSSAFKDSQGVKVIIHYWGGGGLCHSSSVQMDRVHEYPGNNKRKEVTVVNSLCFFLCETGSKLFNHSNKVGASI